MRTHPTNTPFLPMWLKGKSTGTNIQHLYPIAPLVQQRNVPTLFCLFLYEGCCINQPSSRLDGYDAGDVFEKTLMSFFFLFVSYSRTLVASERVNKVSRGCDSFISACIASPALHCLWSHIEEGISNCSAWTEQTKRDGARRVGR